MNTLIAYATKYGCAKKCAVELSKELKEEVELVNLKEKSNLNLSKYDRVIIGGSIYMGKIQKEVTDFISGNLNELLTKETGLFICGMQEGDMLEKEIKENFPSELISKAKLIKYFGGEFNFNSMNFMEKLIVKKVAKITSNKSYIRHEDIKKFAQDFKL